MTILQIKLEHIADARARANVARELAMLAVVVADMTATDRLAELIGQLRQVNEDLWQVEDAIREREAAGDFGPLFIGLARSVYRKNDLRAAIKRAINADLGSALVEEKSYAAMPTITIEAG